MFSWRRLATAHTRLNGGQKGSMDPSRWRRWWPIRFNGALGWETVTCGSGATCPAMAAVSQWAMSQQQPNSRNSWANAKETNTRQSSPRDPQQSSTNQTWRENALHGRGKRPVVSHRRPGPPPPSAVPLCAPSMSRRGQQQQQQQQQQQDNSPSSADAVWTRLAITLSATRAENLAVFV